MIDNLQTIYPASALLQQYIYCYYIIENTGAGFNNSHYSFPHTYNALSIYNNGEVFNARQRLKVVGNKEYAPFAILQGKCQKPLLIDLEGQLSRITILFKPLGLNHFMQAPLGSVMGSEPSVFTAWQSKDYNGLLTHLFTGGDMASRIGEFENYLLSIYTPINQPQLLQALDYLTDFTNERTVEEIAALVGMPLRTFNRLFKRHLGVSPVAHRQIARFRHSLEHKLFTGQFKKLTEIGYSSNFYDQSTFVKLYRQLSGLSPKTFFSTVKKVGDSKLVFQYLP